MEKPNSRQLHWVRLDNAAKIYPAARRKNWSNVFRQSVTLHEQVDTQVLHEALEITVRRFPSIAARLCKGVFWYYLQQVESAPEIKEEYSYPLTFMSKAEMNKCAFRVIVYGNRIAVEFFHSLTDGTGALIFLKNLTAQYLELKHGIQVPCEHGIVDRTAAPTEEELEDCFPKNAGPVPASRKATNAWRMDGMPQTDGFLTLTCFRLPVEQMLALAHQYNVTLTVFTSAVIMAAMQDFQNEVTPNRRRQKPIKLLIPVNLRNLFPSNTLRNFVMFSTPEIDPRLGHYELEEICKLISHKMGLDLTQKHMSSVIATNVSSEQNTLIRLIPLPVKNTVMKAIFDSVGEKKSCMSLSNLGAVKVPAVMEPYIRRFDFILGIQATAPYNCGMLSYGDTLYISFIRKTKEAELERHFFAILQRLGVSVTVESNRNER